MRRREKRVEAKSSRVAQERRGRRSRKVIDRAGVYARDKGVCALCGVDTDRLVWWLANVPRLIVSKWAFSMHGVHDRFVVGNGHVIGRHALRAQTLLGRLWRVRLPLGARLWEADHITPIAEGGIDDLSNLRTLCRRCHSNETAALKGRLARRPTKAVGRGF